MGNKIDYAELQPLSLPQAIDGKLSWAQISKEGLIVRIPKYTGIKPSHYVALSWSGRPSDIPDFMFGVMQQVGNTIPLDMKIPGDSTSAKWQTAKISYSVTTGPEPVGNSPVFEIEMVP